MKQLLKRRRVGVMTEWMRPQSLEEALDLLAESSQRYKKIAGGTDVMVELQIAPERRPQAWLDLSAVAELQDVTLAANGLRIGACVTLAALRRHPQIQTRWPMLAASAAVTGAAPIQNRATLGGNVCNASPAADNAPVLLAYSAQLEISSPCGTRWMPYDAFHCGYRQTALADDELLAAIWLPYPPEGVRSYYRKVGTRAAQAIAKVGIAALLQDNGLGQMVTARFGLASVAATPCMLPTVSNYLQGRDLDTLSEAALREKIRMDLSPIKDIRSTAEYRLEIASRLVWDAIHHAQ